MSSTTVAHLSVLKAIQGIGAPCTDADISTASGIPLLRVRELLDSLVIDDKVTRQGAAPGVVVYQRAGRAAEPARAAPEKPPEAPGGRGGNRAWVAQMHAAGESITVMAARLGISEDGVKYHLRTLGKAAPAIPRAQAPAKPKAATLPKASVSVPNATATPDAAHFAFWNTGELQIEARGSQVRLCGADRAALKQFLHQLPD